MHVANVLHHLPYGRELMHLGLQTMAHRHGIPEKYRPDITDMWWDRLDLIASSASLRPYG